MAAGFALKGARELADVQAYGVKAVGLAALPPDWTPGFAVFGTATPDRIDGDPSLLGEIGAALRTVALGSDGVIVRSSSVAENLSGRGSLDSVRCAADPREIRRAMGTIAARAGQGGVSQVAYVIQSWLPAQASGHLSNERRVSERGTRWRWELESGEAAPAHGYLRVDGKAKPDGGLACGEREDLIRALRVVARSLWDRRERVHVEWVWDGKRLWVVQRDVDETPEGRRPGSEWKGREAPPLGGELRLFRSAARAGADFPKARHVQTFREASLPFADVRILAGSVIMRRLAEGKVSRELHRDLSDLAAGPLVVRTDVRAAQNRPRLLLRRTDTAESCREVEAFLTETAAQLIAEGIAPNDLAFLVHRFTLAEAGAFAYARPGGRSVLIDSTWGLPDSLLYHSHDSCEVELASGAVQSHLRCKNEYIDIGADGKWRSKPAGRPWDWKPAAPPPLAREVARQAQCVADTAGFDVEVMFFIGSGGEPESVLPWFFSEPERDLEEIEESPGFYVGRRMRVSDEPDLARLEAELNSGIELKERISIQFLPSFERLRDRDFVRAVGEFAYEYHIPVDLEGSHLSHSFYLLQSAGASVRCVDVWQRRGRRRTFGGKLVRDLIPIRIARHGEIASTHTVTKKDLAALIKAKAIEEAVEYYWSEGQAEGAEELADLLELVRAGATALDVGMEAIEELAIRKRVERGGFEKGIVLVETTAGRDRGDVTPGEEWGSLLAPETDSLRRPAPRRVHRMPECRLVLPIAPPTGWARREPRVIALDAGEEAVITYGDATIQVQVRAREEEADPDQMVLPALPEALGPSED
jgi:predicted house-cleaning noncanonical NTP pyrophosphatase (MazG superfamily)